MPEYTPPEPPQLIRTDIAKLTDEQDDKRKQLIAHFSDPEYKVGGDANGELSEEEKFWLVSLIVYTLYDVKLMYCIIGMISPMSVF